MTLSKKETLEKIKGKLIVSCQARVGWAMYGSNIMAAFAKAAQEGGASGIRATGVDNLKAIKEKVDLPLIGINKIFVDGYDVYITPSYQSAMDILDVGIEVIAIDATDRERPGGEKVIDIVNKIKKDYPEVLIMGEISTLQEAKNILDYGFDFISTTLCGYTEASKAEGIDNLTLLKQIKEVTDIPVIQEGHIRDGFDCRAALDAGAYAVVVGTAITRPEIITANFIRDMNKPQIDEEILGHDS